MVISSSKLNLFISLGITLGSGKHIGLTSVCLCDLLNPCLESLVLNGFLNVIRAISYSKKFELGLFISQNAKMEVKYNYLYKIMGAITYI